MQECEWHWLCICQGPGMITLLSQTAPTPDTHYLHDTYVGGCDSWTLAQALKTPDGLKSVVWLHRCVSHTEWTVTCIYRGWSCSQITQACLAKTIVQVQYPLLTYCGPYCPVQWHFYSHRGLQIIEDNVRPSCLSEKLISKYLQLQILIVCGILTQVHTGKGSGIARTVGVTTLCPKKRHWCYTL